MTIESWDALDIDCARATLLTVTVSLSVASIVTAGSYRTMGPVSVLLGGISGMVAAYLVLSAPKRMSQRAAFRQAIEAPSLAASANIYLRSTCSRSKTILMLDSEEPMLRAYLASAKKRLLLGHDAVASLSDDRSSARRVCASVRTVLSSVVRADTARIDERGEEIESILGATDLNEETKMPIFIAISFFMPIMLMLVAAVTRNTSPLSVLALVMVEIVLLDITLAVSARTQGWDKR